MTVIWYSALHYVYCVFILASNVLWLLVGFLASWYSRLFYTVHLFMRDECTFRSYNKQCGCAIWLSAHWTWSFVWSGSWELCENARRLAVSRRSPYSRPWSSLPAKFICWTIRKRFIRFSVLGKHSVRYCTVQKQVKNLTCHRSENTNVREIHKPGTTTL